MTAHHILRILALGQSDQLDKMTACLSGAGYAMVQLTSPAAAQRILELADIDAVVADGSATGLTALLSADASDRPWLLLGQPSEGPVPEGRATVLAANISNGKLCDELARLLIPAHRGTERWPRLFEQVGPFG